jgi:hypothetical protein
MELRMFKKSGIALALAALAANGFAAELTSDKDTKFEINVDVGAYFLSTKGTAGTPPAELLGKGLNQVEIKATKKINDDISIFGEIEVDYDPVIDNNAVITDDTRVGIASKMFGRVSVGQFDSFFEDNVIEALGVGHGEKGFVTEPESSNDGRHIQYQHKIGGFSFAVDLTSSINALGTENGVGSAYAVKYELDNFAIAIGHSNIAKFKSDTKVANDAKTSTGLTASYKFGDTKVIGLVAEIEPVLATAKKTTFGGVALTHTMGAFDVGVALQNRDNGTKTFSEWAFGVGYTPFKNMQVYLDLNGLNDTNDKGDVVELGMKYTF